jgi:hypothetical protein
LVAIGLYSPFHFHGKICNDRLLQLLDCIELMKNEVKKKMHARNERRCTKVTVRQNAKDKITQSCFANRIIEAIVGKTKSLLAIRRGAGTAATDMTCALSCRFA